MKQTLSLSIKNAQEFLTSVRDLPSQSNYQTLKTALRDARNIIADLLIEFGPKPSEKRAKKQEVKLAPGLKGTRFELFSCTVEKMWWGPFLVSMDSAQRMGVTHMEVVLEGDLFDENHGMLGGNIPSYMERYLGGGEGWQRTKPGKPATIHLYGYRIE